MLAPVVLAGIYGGFHIADTTPQWVYWAIGLRVLQGIDALYAVAVFGAVLGLALAWHGLSRRGRSPRRERSFRIVLLTGSILLGALGLEAASAIILARQGRRSALPAGGSASARDDEKVGRKLPKPIDEVELPTEFPEKSDRLTVAVVGESSAAGVPFDRWLSIGSVVSWGLERAIPGRAFQHETLARSGDTLEGQHQHLAEIRHRPDVLIVYCGHNEFSARIPLSRDRAYYADADRPSLASTLAEKAVAWSFVHKLVARNIEKCRIAIPPPSNGNRALIDSPAYTPEEYDLLLGDFRRRLEAIASYAEKLGSILVLIAPPGNDSGYDPNRSYLPPETPEIERQAVERAYLAAKGLEESDPSAAMKGYRDLLERAPGFAAARWRLARLLAEQGDTAGAYEQAIAARDLDGYPQRCPTAFQEVYRDTARRHDAIYVDGQAYFHAVSPDGLLDDRLFHDAMHPSYRGQLALAQAVLRGLHARRAFGWPADAPEPVLDPAECAEHFKLDPGAWRTLCLWGMMSYEITGPASFDPTLRRFKYEAFARAADSIEMGVPPGAAGFPGIGRMEPIPVVPYGDATAPAVP
ncbi:hypothetical protein [Paludisphaera soli]|uniref:hypothetical protein n=1 Tax=Paludisphaera soli TaxID=2712865 RepID=UPI0013EE0CFD|nr:hypothetical protein [Paludisphaera soli]